jgi:hypothetical protein
MVCWTGQRDCWGKVRLLKLFCPFGLLASMGWFTRPTLALQPGLLYFALSG